MQSLFADREDEGKKAQIDERVRFFIPLENQYQKIEIIKLLTWGSLNTQIRMGSPSDLSLKTLCKAQSSERYFSY